MIFLQQLECGYGFPALIHVWIASAGVLEWFISTSGVAHTRAVAGKSHMKSVFKIWFLGKIWLYSLNKTDYTFIFKQINASKPPNLHAKI